MSRLKEQYQNEIVDAMIKKFGYKNIMEVPKLDKIVVNMGVGEAKENAKLLEAAIKDMETITGQKAVPTKAKNAIANFKIREGMAIGCKTTLRGEKMYEFMDRLINLALPRVRDFRGAHMTVKDITVECGWYSQSYFTKLFIEREGCTPVEYRRSFGK